MSTGRVEAFSDGVIAIILTIMVLELKVPADASPRALLGVVPLLLVDALSFLTVAIMWVNHHHYLRTARRADSALLWTNNNLLFWMSLIPFATRYLGQNLSSPLPVCVYGGLLAVVCAGFYALLKVLGIHNMHHEALAAEYRHQCGKSLKTLVLPIRCLRCARVGLGACRAGYGDLAAIVLLPPGAEAGGGGAMKSVIRPRGVSLAMISI